MASNRFAPRKEYLRKKRNDDYLKELDGYDNWIKEGERIIEQEEIMYLQKEMRRMGKTRLLKALI